MNKLETIGKQYVENSIDQARAVKDKMDVRMGDMADKLDDQAADQLRDMTDKLNVP